jgi:hypothetical protein
MKGFGTCPQRRSAALRALRGRPRVSAHAVSDWCQFDGAGSLSSIPASRGKTPGSSPSTAGYAMNYSTRGASTRCRKPRGSRRLALRLQRAQAPLRRRRIHPEPSSPYKGPRPTNPTSHSDWTTEWVPLRSRRFGPTAPARQSLLLSRLLLRHIVSVVTRHLPRRASLSRSGRKHRWNHSPS